MVHQIMTQHDAIYLVGSLIMMNDGQSLLFLIFDNWAKKCVGKSLHPDDFEGEILNNLLWHCINTFYQLIMFISADN